MMMIAPISCAREGMKKRGKVKGEYEGMIMIAPISRARKGGKEREEVKDLDCINASTCTSV